MSTPRASNPESGGSTAPHLRSALRAPRSGLSRRGFLVLGGSGAAAVALGACGAEEDPRGEGDDPELIAAAIGAETAYGLGARTFADQQGVSTEIERQSKARRQELVSLEQDDGGESQLDGENVNEAALAAIAAYRGLARLGSSEDLRRTATQFMAQVAGELAALLELQGDDEVPYAFVTGLDEEPLESTDDAPTAETTTTTTTSTGEGGG